MSADGAATAWSGVEETSWVTPFDEFDIQQFSQFFDLAKPDLELDGHAAAGLAVEESHAARDRLLVADGDAPRPVVRVTTKPLSKCG